MCDYKFRLILIGDSCVGKTSFAKKLCDNIFLPVYEPTIGVDYLSKTIIINNEIIKCQIWDTTGQIRFANLLQTYYKNIAGAIFIYDINKKSSFENIKFWLKELNKQENKYPITKLLIGNITHNSRKISKQEAEHFCLKHDFLYTEIDIKNGRHLEQYLTPLLNNIYLNKAINKGVYKKISNYKKEVKKKTNSCCCWKI